MADNLKEWEQFFLNLETKFSSYNFRNQMKLWLKTWCEEYLADIYNQIIDRNIIDEGDLLQSFYKGEKDNIWIESDSGLTIEVGSSNKYGVAVNNGHKTVSPKKASIKLKNGEIARWIPGTWSGDKFIYKPGAKTGMLLKQQWIEAQPFFTSVERHASENFKNLLSEELDKLLEKLWV